MGLTASSTGSGAVDRCVHIERQAPGERLVALAGNPNVGKSTVFNILTGMRQHTGNWPGKTVANAQGVHESRGVRYRLVDLPGTYSLLSGSAEEEIARDFLCFGGQDAAVVVADATGLERNLNLLLQTMEITPNVVLCVNLMDEARRKGVSVNLKELGKRLGIPVVGTSARNGEGIPALMEAVRSVCEGKSAANPVPIRYTEELEAAVDIMLPELERFRDKLSPRWAALRLLEGDRNLSRGIMDYLGLSHDERVRIYEKADAARESVDEKGMSPAKLRDAIVRSIVVAAEEIAGEAVESKSGIREWDRKLDRLLTGRILGLPLMILLLCGVLWLSIVGANAPSELLAMGMNHIEGWLSGIFLALNAPGWLHGLLVEGMFRTLGWVVSVMLPPMAIFFPLFTLLEDVGYLPRIAFNLDSSFKKASACGKQALTMCMGFGCNAAGVTGCRIIDSPRERMIAILTNSFVPCNGRFPTLITIIGILTIGLSPGIANSALSALLLAGFIVLGVAVTLLTSRLLSKTVLKGKPSSFTLEMPPYRRPRIVQIIIRSIFDRTLFVLGRAVAVAAPAGAVIWLMANLSIGEVGLLTACAGFLDPLAGIIGLDGVILMAFILGLPANEIVLPIIVMGYMAQGSLVRTGGLEQLFALFTANGWTPVTAVCVAVFCLCHFPCSTTLLTVKKETGSWRWTAIAFLLPTAVGALLCAMINAATSFYFY